MRLQHTKKQVKQSISHIEKTRKEYKVEAFLNPSLYREVEQIKSGIFQTLEKTSGATKLQAVMRSPSYPKPGAHLDQAYFTTILKDRRDNL